MLMALVSAKARQLNHRLKHRKVAIVSRRENEKAGPSTVTERQRNGERRSASPAGGFVAVNSKSQPNGSSKPDESSSSTAIINGHTSSGASAATRDELLRNFQSNNDRASSITEPDQRAPSSRSSLPAKAKSRVSADSLDYAGFLHAAASPVAIPNTPSSLIPHAKPSAAERYDDSGPYKADMMLRMEQLNRGDRVMPPCDRCRRLHMDCLKNLTACMGCTKKHAKCSWKDVEEQELRDHPFVPRVVLEGKDKDSSDEGHSTTKTDKKDWNNDGVGVRDEELLGESSDSDYDVQPSKPSAKRSYEAKSHSPPTTFNATMSSRNGAKSAPATTAHPSPLAVDTHKSVPASSVPPSSSIRRPEIPIYRPPTDNPVRTFTAHEWDSYTRHSPTVSNARATPTGAIHDELKSAALEAERKFRNNDVDEPNVKRDAEPKQEHDKEGEKQRTEIDLTIERKPPMAPDIASKPSSPFVSTKQEKEVVPAMERPLEADHKRTDESQNSGRPTPPPEIARQQGYVPEGVVEAANGAHNHVAEQKAGGFVSVNGENKGENS